MTTEPDHIEIHRKRKEDIRKKLKRMVETKDNQRIYHELMESL